MERISRSTATFVVATMVKLFAQSGNAYQVGVTMVELQRHLLAAAIHISYPFAPTVGLIPTYVLPNVRALVKEKLNLELVTQRIRAKQGVVKGVKGKDLSASLKFVDNFFVAIE